jgi:hypothetical protein
MKKTLTTLFVVLTSYLFGQGFTYSYVDPCSRQVKTLQITNNQAITVNYLGNINSFSSNDFVNGAFDNWVNQITAATTNQPCDELLTNTQVSQNMFITQNLISTLTSITAASTMTASNAVSNSVSNSNSSGKSKRGGNSNTNNSSPNNQSNTSTNGASNNSQGNLSTNTTTQGGGAQQGGNAPGGSSTSGGNNSQGGTANQSNNISQGGSGTSQQSVNNQGGQTSGSSQPQGQASNQTVQKSTPGQSGGQNVSDGSPKQNESGAGSGGTANSISNAAEATSSGGSNGKGSKPKVGSVIGTGDIVAIRVNEDKSNQFRGTMSVTKSNTNNTKAKGFLLNYTTSVRNSNLTLYGAFNNKKKTNSFIIANSSMLDFERNFFNTTTALESKKFGKTSLMGGLNLTAGGIGGKMFTNLSAVGGGFVPFKVSKNLSGNILLLGVYSPFTKFYDGKWWDSGWLVVPFSSWDYAISKNFKYNVSLSGTYELKGSVLQFQILTGGKILL